MSPNQGKEGGGVFVDVYILVFQFSSAFNSSLSVKIFES